jgi:endoglucanase
MSNPLTKRGAGHRWAALLLVLAITACGHSPDVTLNPQPPPIEYVPVQRPFAGATLAVDADTQGARWQREHRADWLQPITGQPQARWLNGFQDLAEVPDYVASARRQGAVPVLVAYFIPNRGCSGFQEGAPYSDYDRSPPRPDSYAAWISQLVHDLGRIRSVVILEPDAVPADCFDDDRAAAIRAAVGALVAARHYVYIDAGHPNWIRSGPMAERLILSGVSDAEGVSLNVSNRYDTPSVARFGEELSDLIGGRDYVVDTGRNGFTDATAEPAAVANDWCNRPDQALGRQAVGSADPDLYPHMAAGIWIKPPGESDGNQVVFPQQDCHGETAPPGLFSPRQAQQLIINDQSQPASVRERVRAIVAPQRR